MRSVPTWQSDNHDAKVPERVQLRIWMRQRDTEGVVRCGISGDGIHPGDDVELDHKTPLSLNGTHSEDNLHWVLTRYHREKSSQEAAIRADSDAMAKSHAGIRNGAPTGLEGRNPQQRRAAKDRRTREANKLAIPRPRSLFRDVPQQRAALPAPKEPA